MIAKVLLFVCTVAVTQAGAILAPTIYGSAYTWNPYSSYPAQTAVATQHSNTLRSPFNLGQVSTQTKVVDTPFSSIRKADIRVTNPGLAVAPAYQSYAAPVVSHVTAPVTGVTSGGLLGVAYSAAPAVSHMTYTNGLGLAYAW